MTTRMRLRQIRALPAVALGCILLLLAAGAGRAASPRVEVKEANCASLAASRAFEGFKVSAPQVREVSAVDYCVIEARIDASALRVSVWAPLNGWNHRIAFMGGGGFRGKLFDGTLAPYFSRSLLSDRYALVSTNGGHDAPADPKAYFSAQFAMDPQKLDDFTFGSEHRALPVARAIVEAFYGGPVQKAFFEGCSMGGHDAMLLSQRYPDDFDGIVARAPAGNIMGLFLQFHRIAGLLSDPAANLSQTQQHALASAVLKQCDDLDGLSDGVISNPAACGFKAQTLRCAPSAADHSACLSVRQLQAVRAITTAFHTAGGHISHPGYNFGGEDQAKGWGDYIWKTPALGASTQALFSQGFIRSFIARDQDYDVAAFRPEDWTVRLDEIARKFQAFDPNLAAFHQRGAKLILWNGGMDTSVSSRDTARYYEAAVHHLGRVAADQTLEFFLAPGVGHCFGGPGADQVDLLKALATWVDGGPAPSQQGLVLAKQDSTGAVQSTRPMCRYPKYARYEGGDPRRAASFRCVRPKPSGA